MFHRLLLPALCAFSVAFSALAQEPADTRKQLFTDLTAMEKIARDRLFEEADWEKFAKLEEAASDLIRQAEQKQAELDQSGKAELYRLFVRASRLEAAEKSKTLTPDQAQEKAKIDEEIFKLAQPLLVARYDELWARKDSGGELTLRETAILDGLTRWRSTATTQAQTQTQTASMEPPDDLNAPRMDLRQLIWTEQIAIMETQGVVRRDLRLKDQLAEIYRWLNRRAEEQESPKREETLKRIAEWKAKKRD